METQDKMSGLCSRRAARPTNQTTDRPSQCDTTLADAAAMPGRLACSQSKVLLINNRADGAAQIYTLVSAERRVYQIVDGRQRCTRSVEGRPREGHGAAWGTPPPGRVESSRRRRRKRRCRLQAAEINSSMLLSWSSSS